MGKLVDAAFRAQQMLDREEDWCREAAIGPNGERCMIAALHAGLKTVGIGLLDEAADVLVDCLLILRGPYSNMTIAEYNATRTHAEVREVMKELVRRAQEYEMEHGDVP